MQRTKQISPELFKLKADALAQVSDEALDIIIKELTAVLNVETVPNLEKTIRLLADRCEQSSGANQQQHVKEVAEVLTGILEKIEYPNMGRVTDVLADFVEKIEYYAGTMQEKVGCLRQFADRLNPDAKAHSELKDSPLTSNLSPLIKDILLELAYIHLADNGYTPRKVLEMSKKQGNSDEGPKKEFKQVQNPLVRNKIRSKTLQFMSVQLYQDFLVKIAEVLADNNPGANHSKLAQIFKFLRAVISQPNPGDALKELEPRLAEQQPEIHKILFKTLKNDKRLIDYLILRINDHIENTQDYYTSEQPDYQYKEAVLEAYIANIQHPLIKDLIIEMGCFLSDDLDQQILELHKKQIIDDCKFDFDRSINADPVVEVARQTPKLFSNLRHEMKGIQTGLDNEHKLNKLDKFKAIHAEILNKQKAQLSRVKELKEKLHRFPAPEKGDLEDLEYQDLCEIWKQEKNQLEGELKSIESEIHLSKLDEIYQGDVNLAFTHLVKEIEKLPNDQELIECTSQLNAAIAKENEDLNSIINAGIQSLLKKAADFVADKKVDFFDSQIHEKINRHLSLDIQTLQIRIRDLKQAADQRIRAVFDKLKKDIHDNVRASALFNMLNLIFNDQGKIEEVQARQKSVDEMLDEFHSKINIRSVSTNKKVKKEVLKPQSLAEELDELEAKEPEKPKEPERPKTPEIPKVPEKPKTPPKPEVKATNPSTLRNTLRSDPLPQRFSADFEDDNESQLRVLEADCLYQEYRVQALHEQLTKKFKTVVLPLIQKKAQESKITAKPKKSGKPTHQERAADFIDKAYSARSIDELNLFFGDFLKGIGDKRTQLAVKPTNENQFVLNETREQYVLFASFLYSDLSEYYKLLQIMMGNIINFQTINIKAPNAKQQLVKYQAELLSCRERIEYCAQAIFEYLKRHAGLEWTSLDWNFVLHNFREVSAEKFRHDARYLAKEFHEICQVAYAPFDKKENQTPKPVILCQEVLDGLTKIENESPHVKRRTASELIKQLPKSLKLELSLDIDSDIDEIYLDYKHPLEQRRVELLSRARYALLRLIHSPEKSELKSAITHFQKKMRDIFDLDVQNPGCDIELKRFEVEIHKLVLVLPAMRFCKQFAENTIIGSWLTCYFELPPYCTPEKKQEKPKTQSTVKLATLEPDHTRQHPLFEGEKLTFLNQIFKFIITYPKREENAFALEPFNKIFRMAREVFNAGPNQYNNLVNLQHHFEIEKERLNLLNLFDTYIKVNSATPGIAKFQAWMVQLSKFDFAMSDTTHLLRALNDAFKAYVASIGTVDQPVCLKKLAALFEILPFVEKQSSAKLYDHTVNIALAKWTNQLMKQNEQKSIDVEISHFNEFKKMIEKYFLSPENFSRAETVFQSLGDEKFSSQLIEKIKFQQNMVLQLFIAREDHPKNESEFILARERLSFLKKAFELIFAVAKLTQPKRDILIKAVKQWISQSDQCKDMESFTPLQNALSKMRAEHFYIFEPRMFLRAASRVSDSKTLEATANVSRLAQ